MSYPRKVKRDVAGGCGEVGRWAEGSRGRAAIRSCPVGRLKPRGPVL